MAISLIVKDYCENCPHFEPCVLKKIYLGGYHDTKIVCESSDKCERLVRHIKDGGKKDE